MQFTRDQNQPQETGAPMKLLVFAHVPPPHHGQSYMVKLMLSGFGGSQRKRVPPTDSIPRGVACYHVDARVSKKLEDIGDFRFWKLLLLFGFCVQAIWYRFRFGVVNFYYVPAPGKSSALYRDWIVMLVCRPFFKRVILHWHAAGLAKWLETVAHGRSRSITFQLMKDADVSIVLSRYNRADAEKLFPRQICVVSNGIPDPCIQFEREVLPRRKARHAARLKLIFSEPPTSEELKDAGGDLQLFRVLFLAHCIREKGLFDAIEGCRNARQKIIEKRLPISLHLIVAGNFVTSEEKAEFDRLLNDPQIAQMVQYAGFVSGAEKDRLLREADLLCFPTFYPNENQPVNLIEAMAFGLAIITTRWRSLPEMLPDDYSGLVDTHSPAQIADALVNLLLVDSSELLRQTFLSNFTLDRHLAGLTAAFHKIDDPDTPVSCSPKASKP